jgi:hypothetical protein
MDVTNMVLILEKLESRYLGMSLILSGPIIVALSQIALAIREIAINSRKESIVSDTQYRSLEWISYIFFAWGWCSIPLGVILIVRTL